MNKIAAFSIDLAARKAIAPKSLKRREDYEHEFQQIGQELEPIYGKRIWADFHRLGCTETKIREAHKICQRKKPGNYPYFRGILKRL